MINWAEVSTLITGGAGFIGANIVRRLALSGARLHLIVRPQTDLWRLSDVRDRVTVHKVDLLDGEGLRRMVRTIRPTIIFHLAMPSGHPRTAAERLESLQVGILATAHLLEAAMEIGAQRFIHFGSSLEYGRYDRPIKEVDHLSPVTDRGMAKATASMLAEFYARWHGIPVVILRPFSVYGPFENPNRFIPTLLRAAMTGEEVRLTAPSYRHDFIFVEDVVEASLRAAELQVQSGEAFNLGTGTQWTNEEVAALVEQVTGRALRLQIGARPPNPPDTSCWVADIEKARRLLGWEPFHDLSSGLKRTWRWMQAERIVDDQRA
ncbi:MAG: NAD-dependent epimerase/dehydratase family protein [Pyrinomonas methylaliphatogenes]|nr:NAD-dependent epimerase/dehydratase family protein [Pyrinomonas methylaliphatogenes]